jgi:hypothetical protein
MFSHQRNRKQCIFGGWGLGVGGQLKTLKEVVQTLNGALSMTEKATKEAMWVADEANLRASTANFNSNVAKNQVGVHFLNNLTLKC